MRDMKRSVCCLIAVLVFVSCALAKTITADELRSHLLSALSLASETDMFIGQIEEARVLQQFRVGHADYLREEARRQAQELRESRSDSEDTKTPALCADQLEHLIHELTLIRVPNHDETLPGARQRVQAIREALRAAGSSL
jgi:hypothetical protein